MEVGVPRAGDKSMAWWPLGPQALQETQTMCTLLGLSTLPAARYATHTGDQVKILQYQPTTLRIQSPISEAQSNLIATLQMNASLAGSALSAADARAPRLSLRAELSSLCYAADEEAPGFEDSGQEVNGDQVGRD
ncbi:hypothetical protein H920_15340 [Fukomys damarensis]|uniref:Uncharacterized protein n=1 Tax=Fukomys damarensis TaxID=885580 RepID=A0A091CZ64_FUKDA|nr:hypothetical protein H920_15340 [Fukomys damarensis]